MKLNKVGYMRGKLKAIDLFAGCGGLSKGFEKAGFAIAVANEFWHPAAESHRINHPGTVMIEGDVTCPEIKKKIIDAADGGVDVIIGGPPCQAYSMAGKRDPNDPRGKLFEDYIELVKAIRPPFFVMENVKGILTMMHDRDDLSEDGKKQAQEIRDKIEKIQSILKHNSLDYGAINNYKLEIASLKEELSGCQEKVVEMIKRRFNSIGYRVEYRVLNAADYGVPQKRERVIFIGTNTGKEIKFPAPTHFEVPRLTLNGTMLRKWVTVKEAIDDLKSAPENSEMHHVLPTHSEKFREKIHNTKIGTSVFKNYCDAFYRCPPNEPARTVKENHNGVFVHYEQDRVMTPRELARLQSFSDDFIFYGSKSIVLKQIGNAVPVGLGKAIGQCVLEMLTDQRE